MRVIIAIALTLWWVTGADCQQIPLLPPANQLTGADLTIVDQDVPTSPQSPNGRRTSKATLSQIQIFSQILNPLSSAINPMMPPYNAACNGSTDDTAAFAAALAAAGGKAPIIVNAQNSCRVTAILISNTGQTIQCFNKSEIKLASGSGPVIGVIANDVSILGCTIDGNGSGVGIQASAVSGLQIDGNAIQNMNSYLFQCENCSAPVFRNNYGVGTASVGGLLISINASSSQNGPLVTGNILDFSASTIVTPAINVQGNVISTMYVQIGAIISNNIVRMPTSPPGPSSFGIQAQYAPNVSVVGNTVYGASYAISVANSPSAVVQANTLNQFQGVGVELAASPLSIISANTAVGQGSSNNGILLDGASPFSPNSSISNNTITGSINGIQTQSVNGVVLTGNSVLGSFTSGYRIQNSIGFSISGGLIDGASNPGVGIILDTSKNGTISGTTIQNILGTNAKALQLFANTAFTIDDIAIYGMPMINNTATIISTLSGGAALGNHIQAYGIINYNAGSSYVANYMDFANQVGDFVGTGSPQSRVFAGGGSTYRRQDGTSIANNPCFHPTATVDENWVNAAGSSC